VKARHRAKRWQRLARIPADVYARFVATTRADPDGVVTEAAALRLAKQGERETTRCQAAVQQAALAPRPALLWQERWETWLPRQEPCDLLLTDPPYLTELDDVAAFARTWLPALTVHAYLLPPRRLGELLDAAVVRTRDLLTYARAHPCQRPRTNPSDGVRFDWWSWDELLAAGVHVACVRSGSGLIPDARQHGLRWLQALPFARPVQLPLPLLRDP